eukprot:4969539-Prymnesium_polylepis.1
MLRALGASTCIQVPPFIPFSRTVSRVLSRSDGLLQHFSPRGAAEAPSRVLDRERDLTRSRRRRTRDFDGGLTGAWRTG